MVACPPPVICSGFQLLNCSAAKAENSLPQWSVGVEVDLGPTLWQTEHRFRDENGLPPEVRHLGNIVDSSEDLGESIEEIPEGGPVCDGVVDGAADENAVCELGDLNSQNRADMTAVTNFPVKSEEFLERFGDIGRGQEVVDEESGGSDMNEIDASIVAVDEDIAIGIGLQAAGERRKERESASERGLEERNERMKRERTGRKVEEATLLDVVTGKHGKVGDGELEVSDSGVPVRENGAFGNQRGCRRRHIVEFQNSCEL